MAWVIVIGSLLAVLFVVIVLISRNSRSSRSSSGDVAGDMVGVVATVIEIAADSIGD